MVVWLADLYLYAKFLWKTRNLSKQERIRVAAEEVIAAVNAVYDSFSDEPVDKEMVDLFFNLEEMKKEANEYLEGTDSADPSGSQ